VTRAKIPQEQRPAGRARVRLVAAGLFAAAFAWSGLDSWAQDHAFLINTTASLPDWAFFVDRARLPARGDLIFFVPPPSGLLRAHFGPRPIPFGKIVYGVAGDTVTRRGRMFFVAGRPVATAKPVSRRGERLAVGPTGTIPRGCYFVATSHPDSFDSRYAAIGWVCRPQVIGSGIPIL
jgi:conjugal transfer pilin signal peptidase TrbI